MPQNQLRLWSALNLLTLLAILYVAVGLVVVEIALGGDARGALNEVGPSRAVIGAVGGLLVAGGAGWFDRRYLPWTLGVLTVGALSATLVTPYWLAPALLAVSAILRARAGRGLDPVPSARRQWLTALTATPLVLALASAFLLQTRSTPLYDAMQADPMASEELPGMAVEYDRSSDRSEPLGIPSPATIDRSWAITDGTSEPDKLAELARLAQASGWRRGPDPVFCGWQKTVDGEDLCLVIRGEVGDGVVRVEISEDIGF